MFFNTNRLLFETFAQANNIENIKAQNQCFLWGESTADWITVLPKHHSQLHRTQFLTQMDIYELMYSYLLSTLHIWRCGVNLSHYSDVTWGTWRLTSPETGLLFLDWTKLTTKLSIIGPLWGESTDNNNHHYHYFHHCRYDYYCYHHYHYCYQYYYDNHYHHF